MVLSLDHRHRGISSSVLGQLKLCLPRSDAGSHHRAPPPPLHYGARPTTRGLSRVVGITP